MNSGSGATTLDIQQGKCETGYRGKDKLTSAEREAACNQAGMSSPGGQASVMIIGVLVIGMCVALAYLIYRRRIRKNSKIKKS